MPQNWQPTAPGGYLMYKRERLLERASARKFRGHANLAHKEWRADNNRCFTRRLAIMPRNSFTVELEFNSVIYCS